MHNRQGRTKECRRALSSSQPCQRFLVTARYILDEFPSLDFSSHCAQQCLHTGLLVFSRKRPVLEDGWSRETLLEKCSHHGTGDPLQKPMPLEGSASPSEGHQEEPLPAKQPFSKPREDNKAAVSINVTLFFCQPGSDCAWMETIITRCRFVSKPNTDETFEINWKPC